MSQEKKKKHFHSPASVRGATSEVVEEAPRSYN